MMKLRIDSVLERSCGSTLKEAVSFLFVNPKKPYDISALKPKRRRANTRARRSELNSTEPRLKNSHMEFPSLFQ